MITMIKMSGLIHTDEIPPEPHKDAVRQSAIQTMCSSLAIDLIRNKDQFRFDAKPLTAKEAGHVCDREHLKIECGLMIGDPTHHSELVSIMHFLRLVATDEMIDNETRNQAHGFAEYLNDAIHDPDTAWEDM